MTRIEIQNVSLGYSREQVLRDVSFQVLPGEVVGLIGPNGCGKSTIIRALTRIISPHKGKILLDGKDIVGISRQELAHALGVVPQMPLLPSAFTAFEIVLMGRSPHLGLFQYEGQREMGITWRAMERTMTCHLAKRRVGELSGGEIQCLLIARVLVQETKAMLLDEPTANLDIGRQVEILNLIKNLCRENSLTVLAALHDLNLASQYCDRLVLISNGRIHAQGTPSEVITPRNIKEVYGAEGCVYAHPSNGLPAVLINPVKGHISSARKVM
ncbi:MAG: ABC transporter ATP-binding protein [Chloroflexi bacterium]|nr:ABC transporter ATP-binding protein [Chloroflexota bacterium]